MKVLISNLFILWSLITRAGTHTLRSAGLIEGSITLFLGPSTQADRDKRTEEQINFLIMVSIYLLYNNLNAQNYFIANINIFKWLDKMADYYSLLGVTPGISEDDLKKAFRKKAMEFHPDRNKGNSQAEEKFKEINEAYAVLSDKKKRSQYDRFGSEGFHKRFSREDIFKDFDFGDIFGGFGSPSNYGSGGNPDLESFLSGQGFGRSRARKGKDVRQSFYIPFEEAALGTKRTVVFEQNGNKIETSFKVPPGSKNGRRLRLVGKGQAGINGGPPGDLYLKMCVNGHHLFKREGDDIIMDQEISLTDTLLGTTIEVPTLTESKVVKIPPCTQSHLKLRLKGMGIPRSRGKVNGDQLVRVIVKYPKDLTEKQLTLINQLKAEGL